MHKVKKGDLVDGISAVVGDEIVLESDILEQKITLFNKVLHKLINANLWSRF